jgi:hypothetical protein
VKVHATADNVIDYRAVFPQRETTLLAPSRHPDMSAQLSLSGAKRTLRGHVEIGE